MNDSEQSPHFHLNDDIFSSFMIFSVFHTVKRSPKPQITGNVKGDEVEPEG